MTKIISPKNQIFKKRDQQNKNKFKATPKEFSTQTLNFIGVQTMRSQQYAAECNTL